MGKKYKKKKKEEVKSEIKTDNPNVFIKKEPNETKNTIIPNVSANKNESNVNNKASLTSTMTENHSTVLNNFAKAGYTVLNQTNAILQPFGKERKLLANGNLWHKIFIINAENYDREFVLKTIIEAVHPSDLIPVSYKIAGKIASFIARNCGAAIEKLARQNFIVQNPKLETKPFVLQVVLSFSNTSETQLNVQDNIVTTLSKRFATNTKIMNLDTFHKDPLLSDLIFCVLSQPKILYFVLHLAKNLPIHTLKLSNNELRIISPLEALSNCKTLTCLDLRNNLIETITELLPLKNTAVTDLWLDGNPLCSNYTEEKYVSSIKSICPQIEKLDGVLLGQYGFPAFRRNFLIDMEGQSFIDQFLEHFFTLYDTNNRKCLEGLYHRNAMFSLTSNYIPNQSTSQTAKLIDYKTISRNILTLSDLSKSVSLLSYGSTNVINKLCLLPATEHDPFTFTVDCVHYTSSQAILSVHGVFREPPESLLDTERVLSFGRTFVLKAAPGGEWNIINDMLHVTNATTVMAQKAFKIARTEKPSQFDYSILLEAKTSDQKECMVDAFKKITTLNHSWANKCLEDSQWNLQKALSHFIDLYKIDRIPAIAFDGVMPVPDRFDKVINNAPQVLNSRQASKPVVNKKYNLFCRNLINLK